MSNTLLSGKFLIRCYRGGNFVTAKDGGHHSIDALISSATTPGPNEVFTADDSNFKVFFLTARNVFLSARNGGGIDVTNDTETFQTERIELAPDALFALSQVGRDGTFSLQTGTGNFIT